MHVLRLVRVLIPLAIVALVVAAASSVLSARPDLQKAKRTVDADWSPLAARLDTRYVRLESANAALQQIPGPVSSVFADVEAGLGRWRDARAHGSIAAQVAAANDVEGLARQLVATANASPRLAGDHAVLTAFAPFLTDPTRQSTDAIAFNRAVTSYEHGRRGPVRSILAALMSDDAIPLLDTTQSTTA